MIPVISTNENVLKNIQHLLGTILPYIRFSTLPSKHEH